MKKIFFVIAIGAFSFASAQNNKDTWVIPVPPKPNTNISTLPKTYNFNYSPGILDQAKLLHTLPNGSKVYALPQDNMPCVVPDMSQYTMIPTVKPTIPLNAIPNPAYPAPSKPMTMTQEQLNKFLELHPKVEFK